MGFGRADEDDGLPDHIRDFWIRWFARRVERSMKLYEETGCLGHRGEADAYRLRMEGLIRGRSAAQVAQMEWERGLGAE